MTRIILVLIFIAMLGFAFFASPEAAEAGRGWCRGCGPFG